MTPVVKCLLCSVPILYSYWPTESDTRHVFYWLSSGLNSSGNKKKAKTFFLWPLLIFISFGIYRHFEFATVEETSAKKSFEFQSNHISDRITHTDSVHQNWWFFICLSFFLLVVFCVLFFYLKLFFMTSFLLYLFLLFVFACKTQKKTFYSCQWISTRTFTAFFISIFPSDLLVLDRLKYTKHFLVWNNGVNFWNGTTMTLVLVFSLLHF